MKSNTVLSVWYIFSIENKTKGKNGENNGKSFCYLRSGVHTPSRSRFPMFKLDEFLMTLRILIQAYLTTISKYKALGSTRNWFLRHLVPVFTHVTSMTRVLLMLHRKHVTPLYDCPTIDHFHYFSCRAFIWLRFVVSSQSGQVVFQD